MRHSPRISGIACCAVLTAAFAGGSTACGSGTTARPAPPYDPAQVISANRPTDGRRANPDEPLEITANGFAGRITDVIAVDTRGRHVSGELSADGRQWRSTSPLVPDSRYRVRVSSEDDTGHSGRTALAFRTGTPPATRWLNVRFGPRAGTYGVGQPLTAELSIPVEDRAARAVVERALRVDSTPAAQGAWYWVDDTTLHYRPKEYWPAHATIEVHSDLAGVKVAERLWGGDARPLRLTTGDRVEAVTDVAAYSMTVYRNGRKARRFAITSGRPGFETRNGVKVVLGKERSVRMYGASVGIPDEGPDSYDVRVPYATRVTRSGEYVHAAPWAAGSLGRANVSHGCTGMSIPDAKWFFDTMRAGDVVRVVNSRGGTLESFGNGWGDWNLSWSQWRKGSALAAEGPADDRRRGAVRLRPEPA
ncbi:L,D-transpeptidase [Streptomyces spectabilis]|uniref:L,D-transpeptidase n=1 Tax=Streptomyces spectabilis TaxID=68270 RepID=A0A516R1K9_STRST|nr:Ig-like domain-containing protein [Streptomyces spectabilis]QDQ09548.1 L,D-transpeptidase [Streptomyces spectabilis]